MVHANIMNTQITVINDPAGLAQVDRFEVSHGTLLLDWLIDEYGDQGFDVPTHLFSGGISEPNRIDQSNYEQMNRQITEPLYIVHTPQGAEYAAVYAIIAAIVVIALMPTPTIPNNNARQARRSPNNDVSGQTNRARLLERVPDIFGTDKAYPDLIAPTVQEYVNQQKFLTDWMVVGRGFYQIPTATIKTGDTPIDDISGSTADFYEPGDEPTQVLRSVESNEVKGQLLKAPNAEDILPAGKPIWYDSTNDLGYMLSAELDEWDGLTPGSPAELIQIGVASFSPGVWIEGTHIVNAIEDWFYLFPEPFTGQTVTDKFQTIYENGKLYALRYVEYPVPNNLPAGWAAAQGRLFLLYDYGTLDDPTILYAGGLTFTTGLETVWRDSKLYKSNFNSLPFTTSGQWENADENDFILLWNGKRKAVSYLNAGTVDIKWTALNEAYPPQNSQFITGVEANPKIRPGVGQNTSGPFVAPGEGQEEIWLDFQNPKGLVKGSNLNKTNEVNITITVEEIDSFGVPTGTSFELFITIADNDRDPRFWTYKITPSNSPMISGNRYRVSCLRTNNESNSISDLSETNWSRLAGITYITGSGDSGTTRVLLTTRATEQVAALQEKKLNMIATRKVATWNGVSVVGDIETGVGLIASNKMADIMLHYMLDFELGQRTEANIDITTLYAIQASLDAVFSGEKGEFSFTFDSKNSPAVEEMIQIAQAARTFITREGSFFSFIRDEIQPAPKALFNRRNKKPESEKKTIKFNKPQDEDGVVFEYIDSRDYKPRTITLPDDLPVGDPNYGLTASNYRKLESIGIKNYSQAWDRAQYELNRLIYSRATVSTTVTQEAIFLPLNSRVLHIDGLKLDDTASDGEVVGIDGLTISTDNRCIFQPATNYSVFFRDDVGDPTPTAISVTAIPGDEFGFILGSAPPFSLWVRGDSDYQKGTLYSFAEDGTSEAADSYLIQRKSPKEDLSVELELMTYDEAYFAADNQIPPPKD